MTGPDEAAAPLATNKRIVYSKSPANAGSHTTYSRVLENESDYENLPDYVKKNLKAMSMISPDGKPIKHTNLRSSPSTTESASIPIAVNSMSPKSKETSATDSFMTTLPQIQKLKQQPSNS